MHAERWFPPRNPIQTEEMVPSDEFVSFPSSHGGGTKLTTSQFVRIVTIYLRIGDVYSSNSPTDFQNTDSRQILKEIELFEPHGLKFE